MTTQQDAIGPIDFAVLEFPGNRFNGEIAPAITDLIAKGTIRVLDIAFISKDADGDMTVIEIEDLDEDQIGSLGGLTPYLADIVSEEDLVNAAEVLVPNSSALLIVWENTWMGPFVHAVRESGGALVASGRIPANEILDLLESSGA